eukprot:1155511-Pelagomonas_calceolata.AAC.3
MAGMARPYGRHVSGKSLMAGRCLLARYVNAGKAWYAVDGREVSWMALIAGTCLLAWCTTVGKAWHGSTVDSDGSLADRKLKNIGNVNIHKTRTLPALLAIPQHGVLVSKHDYEAVAKGSPCCLMSNLAVRSIFVLIGMPCNNNKFVGILCRMGMDLLRKHSSPLDVKA